MLIREDVASQLLVATRVLAYAGVLNADFRLSARAGEVIYVNRRGASNTTMSPEDIAAVWLTDGYALRGEPPESIAEHLDVYRADDAARAVLSVNESVVMGPSVRAVVLGAIRATRPDLTRTSDEESWSLLEDEARGTGALIGL